MLISCLTQKLIRILGTLAGANRSAHSFHRATVRNASPCALSFLLYAIIWVVATSREHRGGVSEVIASSFLDAKSPALVLRLIGFV